MSLYELFNNKEGWKPLGLVKCRSMSGTYFNNFGQEYLTPQFMIGVEVDVKSEEFKACYPGFVTFPPAAIFGCQHNIIRILNEYFEE